MSLRAKHVHRPERILMWLAEGEQEEGIKETRWEPGKDQISDGLVLSSMTKYQCRVLRARDLTHIQLRPVWLTSGNKL